MYTGLTHTYVYMHMCAHTGDAPVVLESGRASCALVCVCSRAAEPRVRLCVCVPACTRNVAECAPRDVCVLPCQVEGSRFVRQTYAAVWVGYEAEGSRLELQRSVIKGLLFQVSCVSVLACLRVAAHVAACLCTRVCVCVVHRRVIQGLLFWVLGHVLPRTE